MKKPALFALSVIFLTAPIWGFQFSATAAPIEENDWSIGATLESDALRIAIEPFIRGGEPGGVFPLTTGAMVIKGGRVFHEFYRTESGFGPASRHPLWSVSKSFLHGFVGAALQKGLIHLEDRSAEILHHPELGEQTIADLLHMSSGLEWSENYEGNDIVESSVLEMLYGESRQDVVNYVIAHPLSSHPGTVWNYSTGTSQILTVALENVFGDVNFPWSELLEPIGAEDLVIERDQSGHLIGGAYDHGTVRDLARFGYLYSKDGVWNGSRILPAGWAEYGSTPAPAFTADQQAKQGDGWSYGAHWWTNRSGGQVESAFTDIPIDTFVAWGHFGQFIVVIPSADLVIVRVGQDRAQNFDLHGFVSAIFQWSIGGNKGLPMSAKSSGNTGGIMSGTGPAQESSWSDVPGEYSQFSSKEMCSCLFVDGLPEDYCRFVVSMPPRLADLWIDLDVRAVYGNLRYLNWHGYGPYPRHAQWQSEREGCK